MSAQISPKRFVIHPAKFILWLFIVSIILFFGGLTSAYIVLKGIQLDKIPKRWDAGFELPVLFWYNTATIIISSMILQWGVWMARRNDFERARIGVMLTFFLGLLFVSGQVFAWMKLLDHGIFVASSNGAESFLYVLTGTHGLHILAGLIFLVLVLLKSSKKEKVHLISFENCATFWHFLGLLWIYLFVFLLVNHQI